MAVNIDEVLRLEAELKAFRERETSPVSLDAKVNLLKYFQVHAVKQYEEEYDNLYYELNRTGGLDCLRSIAPVRSTGVFQPKVLNLQDCSEDEQLEKQLEFYLADAELAKPRLDELVMSVADDMIKYEVQCVEVKSRESTRRKASTKHDGDVRKVADMARVTVICATPEALEEAYLGIMGSPKQRVLRVKNGFNSDWMPGGYRDVKLNPVVNEHLCEIQLQLREFFALKGGQHAVYEWARELTVTTEMRGEHPFKNTSPEVTKEMMRLAEENWYGTEPFLEDIQFAAGHYDLAEKSHRQGKYSEAKPLHEKAQAIQEKLLGPEHPDVATSLNNRAELLTAQGKYEEADLLSRQAIAINEAVLGPQHPRMITMLNNRARLLEKQAKYEEAEPLYERSLAISDNSLGPDHPEVATTLNNRAGLLRAQGKYEEAEHLHIRSLAIDEKVYGPDHPKVAAGLRDWARLLERQTAARPSPLRMTHAMYDEAEPHCRRSLAINEKVYGPAHPEVATGLHNWAALLKSQGKYNEAEPLYQRAQEIVERSLGRDHPNVATILNNRALVLGEQGIYAEAEPLHARCQTIFEKILGSGHPNVATLLNNRAEMLSKQGKYAEAEPLYERSQSIREKAMGSEHPDVASSLNDRAGLLKTQGKYKEAETLYRRSLAIDEKVYRPDHPYTVLTTRRSLQTSTPGRVYWRFRANMTRLDRCTRGHRRSGRNRWGGIIQRLPLF
ncbi:unnamed protein product [Ectocarpus sp. 12 AP-2014]